jgi:hypothetical protein
MSYRLVELQFHPDPAAAAAADGQRNCPKHAEFHSKIEFEKISASSWFYYKD